MSYTTEFSRSIEVTPPLNQEEIRFLNEFSASRRMNRSKGPYYVGEEESDVLNHNRPPEGQPGLWCQWIPNESGTEILWDENENFYYSAEWMEYLIDHFFGSDPKAKPSLPFLTNHVLNGEILAQGEEISDRWILHVVNNVVETEKLR
jgi:hypothetical protein